MLKSFRSLFSIVLAAVYLLSGCGNGNNTVNSTPVANLSVVVFSDLHFDPFYDRSLFPALLAADPSQWESIFKTSTMTTPSAWGTDTNYPLMVLALSAIKQQSASSPLIIYTGDLLGHYIPQIFFQLYGSSDAAAIAAMQNFTEKVVTFVTTQIRSSIGKLPVVFALGNIDSYTGYGPDSTFLLQTADTFYTKLLNGTVDHQTFVSTFTTGGYYSSEPMGPKLTVIALNTTPLSPLIPANTAPNNNDVEVNGELAWLDSKLATAQAAGQKVWLLMHVPPGADTVTTSTTPADIQANGYLATAAMMWVPAYQTSFLQIIAKYPGVITLMLGAHTHMDEYRILSSDNVMDQTPAISPAFGNNPAFKVFTLTGDTFTPVDYTSFIYDLASSSAQFHTSYTFSAAYSQSGLLQSAQLDLYPQFVRNTGKQAVYTRQYNSGDSSFNPNTQANWNPVTSANWPLFWCGIKNMAQQDLVNCVNTY